MPPVEITIKASPTDTFPVEIDDDEDVASLAAIIESLRPEFGEQMKLMCKGKVLKEEQVIKDLGLSASDSIVVFSKKSPASEPTPTPTPAVAPSPVDAMLAAAQNAAYNPAPPAPTPPVAPSAQTGGLGPPDEAIVQNLCSMGFDRPLVLKALQAAFNNGERAAEYLLTEIPSVETDAPAPVAADGGGGGQWPESVLGPQLLTKSGPCATKEVLQSADVVMLYFSAHWCPPCKQFTPMLARGHGYWPKNLAAVFISSDRDEASFAQYYNEMPWFAMPFNQMRSQMLGAQFGVQGIPTVVVLNGRTGALISANGKMDIAGKQFDMAGCMAAWGVTPTFAPSPTPVQATTPAVTAQVKPAVPEKPEPAPAPIDDAVATAALTRIAEQTWEVQEPFFTTGMKVLNNILQNPGEQKFRQLKRTNATLSSKLLNVAENAGVELMQLAGFEATSEELLVMQSEPDGRCTEVRNRLKASHYTAWEKHARQERDAKIKEEMDKDKSNAPRHYGGDGSGGGRNTYGADRHRGRGGG